MASNPQLTHQNLCLRPFVAADADLFITAVLESVASVGQWLPWCHANYSVADALAWFAHCEQARADGTAHELGIFALDSGELLGGAGLNGISLINRRTANLGYWVRQSQQRQGIASQIIPILSEFGFKELKLLRVEIVVIQENLASNAAARKAGAHFEGFARNGLILHDIARTAAVYSLIPAPRND